MSRIHRYLGSLVVTLGATLSGCFGGCGPSTLGVDVLCADAPAPAKGAPQVLFGSTREDAFRELDDGDQFPINFGDQGGQHIYYALRLYQPKQGRILSVKLLDGGSAMGGGGAGGNNGGAGGAGGNGAGGSSGEPDYIPSDFVFLDDYIGAEDCEGWMQLQNLLFQVSEASGQGLLVFDFGTCAASGCTIGSDGNYEVDTVEAHFEVQIGWN